MIPLSTSELTSLCNLLKNEPPKYYPSSADWIRDLLSTGCRPNEVLDLSKWKINSANNQQYILTPSKNNKDRIIFIGAMSQNFNNAFKNGISPYNSLSLRQLEFSMQLINPAGKMKVGNRNTIAYIFRYNKVNELLLSGFDWKDVQTYFGWFSPEMPYSYSSRIVEVGKGPPW